jgi:MSHA biogenesis protein MshJ
MKAALKTWWTRRAPRERKVVFAAVAVLALVAIDTIAFAPQRAELATMKQQRDAARRHLDELQKLAAHHSEQGSAEARARLEQLASRRAQTEQVLANAQLDLTAPREMAQQLATVLAQFPRLRVLAAASQAPVPINEPQASAGTAPAAGTIYRHGLELTVEGQYFDVMAYLEMLESARHRIYWRELDLKVDAQGVPITRVAVFTLSKEPAWMRL